MKPIITTILILTTTLTSTFGVERWLQNVQVERITSYDSGEIFVKTSGEVPWRCDPSTINTFGQFVLLRDSEGIYKDRLSILLTAKTTGSSVDVFYVTGEEGAFCEIKRLIFK